MSIWSCFLVCFIFSSVLVLLQRHSGSKDNENINLQRISLFFLTHLNHKMEDIFFLPHILIYSWFKYGLNIGPAEYSSDRFKNRVVFPSLTCKQNFVFYWMSRTIVLTGSNFASQETLTASGDMLLNPPWRVPLVTKSWWAVTRLSPNILEP